MIDIPKTTMATAIEVAPTSQTPPASSGAWNLAEECLMQTSEALLHARVATAADLVKPIAQSREHHAAGKPSDLLETYARSLGYEEEHISPAILDLSNHIAAEHSPFAPLIPFAGKLIAPSAFYESFNALHELGRVLLTPVIFVEDTDAIGLASINPIACSIFSSHIAQVIQKRFGIRPFISIARLDYESWTFLTRKHFEL